MVHQCQSCGKSLDEHTWHFRSTWPDRIFNSLAELNQDDFWGNDDLLQVPGYGSFVRILVRIRLIGLPEMSYRVWLEVLPDDLLHAWHVWELPEYQDLAINGALANTLLGWPSSVLHQWLEATVQDAGEVPIAAASSNDTLSSILSKEWDPTRLAICRSHQA